MPDLAIQEANIGGGAGVMAQIFLNRVNPYNLATGRGGEDPAELSLYLFDGMSSNILHMALALPSPLPPRSSTFTRPLRSPADTPVTHGKPSFAGAQFHHETHQRWNRWDAGTATWVPMSVPPPSPSGRYAIVGGTRLTATGERAITELFDGGGGEVPTPHEK